MDPNAIPNGIGTHLVSYCARHDARRITFHGADPLCEQCERDDDARADHAEYESEYGFDARDRATRPV